MPSPTSPRRAWWRRSCSVSDFGYLEAPLLSPGVDPLATALFIATAFSITALPILGRMMMEFKITRLPIGVIAISAAAINDVIGWLLLALVTALTLAAVQCRRLRAQGGAGRGVLHRSGGSSCGR